MLGLLLYAYCVGVRSSRPVEWACCGDVAFKVITAMQVPDHSTVADFRRRHEDLISELFVEVLALGRPVIGFMCGNQPHPDMMCQVFVLAPTGFVEDHEIPAARTSSLG